jgi:hypothetical protein
MMLVVAMMEDWSMMTNIENMIVTMMMMIQRCEDSLISKTTHPRSNDSVQGDSFSH